MMSLFATFDMMMYPQIAMAFLPFLFTFLIWSSWKNNFISFVQKNINTGMKEYLLSTITNPKKSTMVLLSVMMLSVILMNLMSLMGYAPSLTAQLSFVGLISWSLWIKYMSIYIAKVKKSLFVHMMPRGTPYWLVPLIFLIELVSICIRPLTLAIRLIANILAGHVIILLICELASKYVVASALAVFMLAVETFVALIQGYIITTLMWIYYSEL